MGEEVFSINTPTSRFVFDWHHETDTVIFVEERKNETRD